MNISLRLSILSQLKLVINEPSWIFEAILRYNLFSCRHPIREKIMNKKFEAFVIPKPSKLKTSQRKNKSLKPWTITQNKSRGN